MTISISIHVDGYYGLVNGVPNLLRLFDRYNIKATFFINMGNEASIFQLLKYRRNSNIGDSDKKVVSRYSKKQLLEIMFLNRGLGHRNARILRMIKNAGHEVNPHCWSHLLWSRNFDKIDYLSEIRKMKNAYFEIFGGNPKGFAPPTWKFNDKVMRVLKDEGFDYLSVNDCFNKLTTVKGLKIIPLSFGMNIEELLNEGRSKKEIIDLYRKELGKKYVNLYFHADFEGLRGIKLFEEVLKLIKNKKTTIYRDL